MSFSISAWLLSFPIWAYPCSYTANLRMKKNRWWVIKTGSTTVSGSICFCYICYITSFSICWRLDFKSYSGVSWIICCFELCIFWSSCCILLWKNILDCKICCKSWISYGFIGFLVSPRTESTLKTDSFLMISNFSSSSTQYGFDGSFWSSFIKIWSRS